jgi:hypothetical protein
MSVSRGMPSHIEPADANFQYRQILPFELANTWDVEQLRDNHQLQQNMYANSRGEIRAPITYYSINENSQLNGTPLHAPYDAPPYGRCTDGPTRYTNADFCVTNIVSRPVESCEKIPRAAIPRCLPGLLPRAVGCAQDATGQNRMQFQCLPTEQTAERRTHPFRPSDT